MACAGTQPTLPPADGALALYAQSLGLVRLAAWYAFERSTSVQAPLSTGTALTQQLFRSLEDVRLFRIPQSGERGVRRALYEPLAWCYLTDWGDPVRLQAALLAALQERSADVRAKYDKLELWESLANAEIETYVAHLLRRHTLDSTDASQIIHAMSDEWAGHCLARRRYLAWSGARGAAAALLRTGMDQDAARVTMLNEMRRRSRWLAAKEAANALQKHDYCFVPDTQWRRSILLEVFLTVVLPIGQAYWNEPPQALRSIAQMEAGVGGALHSSID